MLVFWLTRVSHGSLDTKVLLVSAMEGAAWEAGSAPPGWVLRTTEGGANWSRKLGLEGPLASLLAKEVPLGHTKCPHPTLGSIPVGSKPRGFCGLAFFRN